MVFVLFYELKKTGMPLLRKKNKVVDKHQNLALGSIKLLNFRSMSITNIQTKKKKKKGEAGGGRKEGRRKKKKKDNETSFSEATSDCQEQWQSLQAPRKRM